MSDSVSREFVINPRTNRLIRKGGPTHRQWLKLHPEAAELPIVHALHKQPHAKPDALAAPTNAKESTKKNKSRKRKRPAAVTGTTWVPPATTASSGSTESLPHDTDPEKTNAWPVQLPELPMSPPPLRRCHAHGEEGFRALMQDDDDVALPEHDLGAMTDEVLHEHGPALVNAFQDPGVDFLEEAAKLLGLVNLRG